MTRAVNERIFMYIGKYILCMKAYSIDLLKRAELFAEANEIIKASPFDSVKRLNQESTTYHTTCNRCLKPILIIAEPNSDNERTPNWFCPRCKSTVGQCSICNEIVKAVYAWCRGCGHGGHAHHLTEWFQTNSECPTGCGHNCSAHDTNRP